MYQFILILMILCAQGYATEDPKAEIQRYLNALSHAPLDQESVIKKDLAIAYYKDQNQEKAFQVFLEAITDKEDETAISKEMQQRYETVLELYLKEGNPKEVAQRLLEHCETLLKQYPNDYLILYLEAIAEANLECFPDFFEHFYQAYTKYPNHYLAYKSKAILHTKLFARMRTVEDKNQERDNILKNLQQAIHLYPRDPTLYKMMLAFSLEEKRPETLSVYLNKIVSENIIIPRSDIAIYVHQAVGYKNFNLAQRLVDQAKEWYPASRTIQTAQQYIVQAQTK
ncbi:MAG: hypothetical protein H0X51_09480 [Parachlamydiaceae bacterium]|nr:hypothetical protein [Parachlamydiaceae bacterium]